MNNKVNKDNQCKHNFEYIEGINTSSIIKKSKDKPDKRHNKEPFKDYRFVCQNCKKEVRINNIEVIEFIQNKFLELFEIELGKPANERLSNAEFIKKVWDEYPCDDTIKKHLRSMMIMKTISLKDKELSEITEDDILSFKCLAKGAFIGKTSLHNLAINFANELGFKFETIKDYRDTNLFSKNSVFNTTHGISNGIRLDHQYYIAKTKDNKYVMVCRYIFGLEVLDAERRLRKKYIKEGLKKSDKELRKEASRTILDKYNLIYK